MVLGFGFAAASERDCRFSYSAEVVSARRAAKAVELTPGDLRCYLDIGAERVVRLAERSAEVSRGHNRRDFSR